MQQAMVAAMQRSVPVQDNRQSTLEAPNAEVAEPVDSQKTELAPRQLASPDRSDALKEGKVVVAPVVEKTLVQPEPLVWPEPSQKQAKAMDAKSVARVEKKALDTGKHPVDSEADPQVAIVVMDNPMDAAAAHQSPDTKQAMAEAVVKVSEPNAGPVIMSEKPKDVSTESPFDMKRFVIYPLLGIGALAALVLAFAKWLRPRAD